jgi:hypothetical protein
MLALAAWVLAAGCAVYLPATPGAGDVRGRRVTVRRLAPPPVNLHDREAQTLAVMPFAGGNGPELSDDLVAQLERRQVFGVVGPQAMGERLLRLGLSVEWDTPPSTLRWVHERAAVDAVVVGRLETFRIAGKDKSQDTLTPVETGEYGFVVNDEGKLAYREKIEYRSVPLYCRTELGTVAASYRVWDARRGERVATVRHEIATEVPSFCYRGDLPIQVERAAQERLLRRLFADLNRQFLADILPRVERAEVVFAPLPGYAGSALVQGNELAILYATRNQWQRAVEVWQDGLRGHPDLAPLHYNLGVAYRATCRLTRARSHLEQARTLAPRNPLYRRALRDLPPLEP